MSENYKLLQAEILELLDKELLSAVDAAHDALRGNSANYNKRVKVALSADDISSLVNQFASVLNVSAEDIVESDFYDDILDVIAKYEDEYVGAENDSDSYVVSIDTIEYTTKYSYITDSAAQDKDYVYTKYTSDNGNVVMVTYKKGNDVVKFLLNYNIYPVDVRLGAGEEPVRLGRYEYKIVE